MDNRLLSILEGVQFLKQGKIVAYPTEAVFGLGCCPQNESALTDLVTLKQRDPSKGMILIASQTQDILPYINIEDISQDRWHAILETWPGAFTWVFPASDKVLPLVKGQYPTVAVRVTAHPVAAALCQAFGGAIVSTSANMSQEDPYIDGKKVLLDFKDKIAGVVEGKVGSNLKPTQIQDAITGKIYR